MDVKVQKKLFRAIFSLAYDNNSKNMDLLAFSEKVNRSAVKANGFIVK